jgi:hypothetical protein
VLSECGTDNCSVILSVSPDEGETDRETERLSDSSRARPGEGRAKAGDRLAAPSDGPGHVPDDGVTADRHDRPKSRHMGVGPFPKASASPRGGAGRTSSADPRSQPGRNSRVSTDSPVSRLSNAAPLPRNGDLAVCLRDDGRIGVSRGIGHFRAPRHCAPRVGSDRSFRRRHWHGRRRRLRHWHGRRRRLRHRHGHRRRRRRRLRHRHGHRRRRRHRHGRGRPVRAATTRRADRGRIEERQVRDGLSRCRGGGDPISRRRRPDPTRPWMAPVHSAL